LLKTIQAGSLRSEHVNQMITLGGWVDRRRDHGNLIFIDLRDSSGITQIVFDQNLDSSMHQSASLLRNEWVIQVTGKVRERPDGTINTELETGQVEVIVSSLTILNESKTPPFYINKEEDSDELLRMKYRYLDLRKPKMQNIVNIRHKAVKFMRDFLTDQGFLEIETPILIKSTPEGARDYLVPSRLYPGKFYSLPQSPQQLKQLLMSAGFEKYFQIARCFRDEDPRADRQPEFTQLDLEMSFVESDDILSLIEKLYYDLVKAITPNKNIKFPFPRIPYKEAIEKYGTDKPDLRFGIEMSTVVDWAKKTDINILKTIISKKGTVKSLNAPGCGNYTRGQISELEELVKTSGGKGLMWIAISEGAKSIEELRDDDIKSPVSKVLKLNEIQEIASILSSTPGDLILIVAGPEKIVNQSLSLIRNHLGTSLGLKDPNSFEFAFITDFPLFEWKEEEKRWDAAHHPFTMPLKEHLGIISTDPSKVIAHCYDLVCNGLECGSGSIRIHSRKLQEEVFGVLGYSKEEVASRFDQLLTAFEYGTPPHGGIATGIERLVMLLTGTDNIRDVVAFPKTQSFIDPLFDAPDYVSNEQLNELHIKVNPTET